MSSHELVDQVAELRRAGRTPKEIARALGLKPAEVTLLFVHRFFGTWSSPPVPAPLEMARHLVFGAVDYARRLGFEPHPDFARGAALLGEWQDGSSDITFGRDGKPMYISGPHDDAYGIMATLRRTVGDGNFDYLTRPGPGPFG